MPRDTRWEWGPDSARALRSLHEKRFTDVEAALKLRCRVDVLRKKAESMNLTFRSASFWTVHRIERMQGLLLEGHSRSAIARRLQTTKAQVCAQLAAMEKMRSGVSGITEKEILKAAAYDPDASLRELCEATACSPALVDHVLGQSTTSKRCPCAYNLNKVARIRTFLENEVDDG